MLLAEKRGVPNHKKQPPLKYSQIRKWAQSYHRSNGRWPNSASGPINEITRYDMEVHRHGPAGGLARPSRGKLACQIPFARAEIVRTPLAHLAVAVLATGIIFVSRPCTAPC
jgi:hypothetical protein